MGTDLFSRTADTGAASEGCSGGVALTVFSRQVVALGAGRGQRPATPGGMPFPRLAAQCAGGEGD